MAIIHRGSLKIMSRFRAYLLAGLAVVVPIVASIYIVWILFKTVDGLLKGVVNTFFVKWLGFSLAEHPIPGLGFVAVIILLVCAGMLTRFYLGRKLVKLGEHIMSRIPFINRVYRAIRQIAEAIFSEKREVFSRAVLIEYPRHGMYSIGFVTQDTLGEIQDKLEPDVLSVFLPTTPNPTSGYLLFVPKRDAILLDMSIEEALRLIVSGGAVKIRGSLEDLSQEEASPPAMPTRTTDPVRRAESLHESAVGE